MADTVDTNKQASILVVDDTVANLKLMLAVLTGAGFNVHPLQDSRLVVQHALADPPDLILLDVDMPYHNGFEVCQRLKEEPTLQAIPVIFISAAGAPLDGNRTRLAGGVDYIEKPIVLERVIQKIRHHLDARCS